jgi:hypothetical protein
MRKSCLTALHVLWPAALCVCLTGCFDTKQEITLNPDGSGKIVMESTFAQPESLLTGFKLTRRENVASECVRHMIEDAQGVDVWRDISFREQEDGLLWVRGTAYFRDLSKFKASRTALLQFQMTRETSGELTLAIRPDTSASPFSIPKTGEPDTKESIQSERRQFRAAQPWLSMTFGAITQETIFRFSGVLRYASNFQTNGPQTLRFCFDGARAVPAVEHILFDPELTRLRLAATSTTNFPLLEYFNEQLFGQRGPVRAVIVPGKKQLFDYAAEVAEARKSFTAMAKELGLADPPVAPVKPAVDGAPARIKVIGVGWRFEKAEPLSSFFGGPSPGYTLSLRAELPGAVFGVDEVEVTRAATLEGVLLEGKGNARGAGWIASPQDLRTNVNFDIYLASLSAESKGLAEVSGVLKCSSAENLRTVELISGRLGAGAKGAEFGAHLDYVGQNAAGSEKLVLRTSLEPQQLRSLKVINEASLTVSLDVRGTMNVGKEYTYTCVARRSIPRSGKLVADVMVGTQTLRIPFSVTNLTLLGQPLAAN